MNNKKRFSRFLLTASAGYLAALSVKPVHAEIPEVFADDIAAMGELHLEARFDRQDAAIAHIQANHPDFDPEALAELLQNDDFLYGFSAVSADAQAQNPSSQVDMLKEYINHAQAVFKQKGGFDALDHNMGARKSIQSIFNQLGVKRGEVAESIYERGIVPEDFKNLKDASDWGKKYFDRADYYMSAESYKKASEFSAEANNTTNQKKYARLAIESYHQYVVHSVEKGTSFSMERIEDALEQVAKARTLANEVVKEVKTYNYVGDSYANIGDAIYDYSLTIDTSTDAGKAEKISVLLKLSEVDDLQADTHLQAAAALKDNIAATPATHTAILQEYRTERNKQILKASDARRLKVALYADIFAINAAAIAPDGNTYDVFAKGAAEKILEEFKDGINFEEINNKAEQAKKSRLYKNLAITLDDAKSLFEEGSAEYNKLDIDFNSLKSETTTYLEELMGEIQILGENDRKHPYAAQGIIREVQAEFEYLAVKHLEGNNNSDNIKAGAEAVKDRVRGGVDSINLIKTTLDDQIKKYAARGEESADLAILTEQRREVMKSLAAGEGLVTKAYAQYIKNTDANETKWQEGLKEAGQSARAADNVTVWNALIDAADVILAESGYASPTAGAGVGDEKCKINVFAKSLKSLGLIKRQANDDLNAAYSVDGNTAQGLLKEALTTALTITDGATEIAALQELDKTFEVAKVQINDAATRLKLFDDFFTVEDTIATESNTLADAQTGTEKTDNRTLYTAMFTALGGAITFGNDLTAAAGAFDNSGNTYDNSALFAAIEEKIDATDNYADATEMYKGIKEEFRKILDTFEYKDAIAALKKSVGAKVEYAKLKKAAGSHADAATAYDEAATAQIKLIGTLLANEGADTFANLTDGTNLITDIVAVEGHFITKDVIDGFAKLTELHLAEAKAQLDADNQDDVDAAVLKATVDAGESAAEATLNLLKDHLVFLNTTIHTDNANLADHLAANVPDLMESLNSMLQTAKSAASLHSGENGTNTAALLDSLRNLVTDANSNVTNSGTITSDIHLLEQRGTAGDAITFKSRAALMKSYGIVLDALQTLDHTTITDDTTEERIDAIFTQINSSNDNVMGTLTGDRSVGITANATESLTHLKEGAIVAEAALIEARYAALSNQPSENTDQIHYANRRQYVAQAFQRFNEEEEKEISRYVLSEDGVGTTDYQKRGESIRYLGRIEHAAGIIRSIESKIPGANKDAAAQAKSLLSDAATHFMEAATTYFAKADYPQNATDPKPTLEKAEAYTLAVATLEELDKIQPLSEFQKDESFNGLRHAAVLYKAEGDRDKAEPILKKLSYDWARGVDGKVVRASENTRDVAGYPKYAEDYADFWYDGAEFYKAIKEYRRAVKSYADSGDFTNGLRVTGKALETAERTGSAQNYKYVAESYAFLGDQVEFHEAKRAEAYTLAANVYIKAEAYEDAAGCFVKAAELCSTIGNHMGAGNAYEKAVWAFKKIGTIGVDVFTNYLNAAKQFEMIDTTSRVTTIAESALADFSAMEVGPRQDVGHLASEILYYEGKSYAKESNIDAAKEVLAKFEHLEQALVASQKQAVSIVHMGNIAFEIADFEQASEKYVDAARKFYDQTDYKDAVETLALASKASLEIGEAAYVKETIFEMMGTYIANALSVSAPDKLDMSIAKAKVHLDLATYDGAEVDNGLAVLDSMNIAAGDTERLQNRELLKARFLSIRSGFLIEDQVEEMHQNVQDLENTLQALKSINDGAQKVVDKMKGLEAIAEVSYLTTKAFGENRILQTHEDEAAGHLEEMKRLKAINQFAIDAHAEANTTIQDQKAFYAQGLKAGKWAVKSRVSYAEALARFIMEEPEKRRTNDINEFRSVIEGMSGHMSKVIRNGMIALVAERDKSRLYEKDMVEALAEHKTLFNLTVGMRRVHELNDHQGQPDLAKSALAEISGDEPMVIEKMKTVKATAEQKHQEVHAQEDIEARVDKSEEAQEIVQDGAVEAVEETMKASAAAALHANADSIDLEAHDNTMDAVQANLFGTPDEKGVIDIVRETAATPTISDGSSDSVRG